MRAWGELIVGGADQPPLRQVRADFDGRTLVVYQAYSDQIADAALAAGTFVPPFKLDRTTWIKPSFLWMMYRCGWATKPGQERVLAIRIPREGFEEALGGACLSHFDPDVHASHEQWRTLLSESPVRVQWDPERRPDLTPLPWRSLQVGLSGPAARSYVDGWITEINDVTPLVHEMRHDTSRSDAITARERPYHLPAHIAERIGVSSEVTSDAGRLQA